VSVVRRRIGVALLLLLGVGLLDAGGRQFLNGTARFDLVQSRVTASKTLFVYFPGILADGVTSSRELVPVWKQHGDVLLISYDGHRFDASQIAKESATKINYLIKTAGYKHVVFIGSSMGGLVSYDTIQQTAGLKSVDVSLVPIDAPTKRSDLQPPLDKISLGSKIWWAGPISNLISKPYFNATFVAPKEDNIEEGVDRDRLNQIVEESKSHPLSWSMDQNRYPIDHGEPDHGSLRNVRVVYVRSTRDNDTTRLRAFNAWNDAAGGNAVLVLVDSTHVGFNERPETWRWAFQSQIIPALGLPD
jgi:pimeloyl-ACP methyl ester carboxylesterase